MGQKVHPYGFRLGYNKDWHSHWYAKKQFGEFLLEDLKLKRDLKNRFTGAGVSHVLGNMMGRKPQKFPDSERILRQGQARSAGRKSVI